MKSGAIVLFLCIVTLTMRGSAKFSGQPTLPIVQLDLCGVSVQLEVATEPEQWSLGLSYRRTLAEGHGMIFAFDRVRAMRFSARNTYIPLSIAFIETLANRETEFSGILREIHPLSNIHENTQMVTASNEYQYALELGAGWFETHSVLEGCVINLRNLRAFTSSKPSL